MSLPLFIPVQGGQLSLMKGQPILSDLMGHIGYETRGSAVVFHKDITIDGIDKVNMRLVVADIGQYGEYDTLPISTDMEMQIVEDLIKQFAPTPQNDSISDNYSEPTKQGGK